tara:strand:- start:34 stop:441 length:408 start_codon:yes stop_codon:yes gene_type:complete
LSLKADKVMESLGINIYEPGFNYYKLKAKGNMDLIVETHRDGKNQIVTMSHYYKQNGDLVPDPDIMFAVQQGIVTYRQLSQNMGNYTEDHQQIKSVADVMLQNISYFDYKIIEKEVNDIEYQLDDQGEMVEVTAQ